MSRYDEKSVEKLVNKLSQNKFKISEDFTNKVMSRIKNDSDFIEVEYNDEKLDNMLSSLKNRAVVEPSIDFTSNVMNRIKEDSSFVENKYSEDNIDNVLSLLKERKEVEPSSDFTLSVMERIKLEESKKADILYNDENIDSLLISLKNKEVVEPSVDFTQNVIDKIKAEKVEKESDDDIISFSKIYKKVLVVSVISAAAAVLLAFNLFSNYDAGMAEFMATDYFNTGIY